MENDENTERLIRPVELDRLNFGDKEEATKLVRELISKEATNSRELAQTLDRIQTEFFPVPKGKKNNPEFKAYIEKEVRYHYVTVLDLLKGWRNPLIRKNWDALGSHRIKLLNRFKGEITQGIIDKIIPMTCKEAKDHLFPKSGESKPISKIDRLKNNLLSVDPSEMTPEEKNELVPILQNFLEGIRRKAKKAH